MGEQLFDGQGLTVTTYTGPARSDGGSRKRVQIYNRELAGDARGIDMSAEQWEALGMWFLEGRAPAAPRRPRSGTGD